VRDTQPALNVEVFVAVTQHEHNMQLVEVDRIAGEIEYIREKHAEYGASIQAVFGSSDLCRWIATQYLRAGRRRRAASSFLMNARRYRAPRDLLRGIAALAGDHHRFDSRSGGGKVPALGAHLRFHERRT
jgi:hypothetical protein